MNKHKLISAKNSNENIPLDKLLFSNENPTLKDPDCKIDMAKSDFFFKKNLKLKSNTYSSFGHPVNMKEIIKFS